ncbi:serine/threonine-protein phosphatase 4 regulatory subunit 2 [Amborella trichopoda]|uniref:serine/threonine-protein phosphatase 4 regulatory subunit 2 n=1 Tax=Amborella trichopoda TaxID=13333 RepID=UPI0005D3BFE5|nr:serine/threonine-protein phosphatase 4 regulatory subunit 2 [Amborella trichopoda]XP_020524885.1 serine/threonine-protein phosphatase 4 regulatory subunit 2 [Amborella trichopoda]|eukprot:XP_011624599.1 serine/threonine-protein phosphatase 4 regulatory subunit 2 [Amborella trichopoda]
MEMASVETTASFPFSGEDHIENAGFAVSNHSDGDQRHACSKEGKDIMEIIAATGKYWHDWDTLKHLLSFHLKQVLAEYPEAHMANDIGPRPSSSLLEPYPDLVKRLDEALLNYVEGPPFTLQRLCEILLNPQRIYPNLSKLALALEKNLSVTSTLTMCTEPYPSMASLKFERVQETKLEHIVEVSIPIQNGGATIVGFTDEEMIDATEVANEERSDTNQSEMSEEVPQPENTFNLSDKSLPASEDIKKNFPISSDESLPASEEIKKSFPELPDESFPKNEDIKQGPSS